MLQEEARNCYHEESDKNKQTNIIETISKGYKCRFEMNIENYLMKKRIQKENMEEIDAEICSKNIKKLKKYQKNYCKLKKYCFYV